MYTQIPNMWFVFFKQFYPFCTCNVQYHRHVTVIFLIRYISHEDRRHSIQVIMLHMTWLIFFSRRNMKLRICYLNRNCLCMYLYIAQIIIILLKQQNHHHQTFSVCRSIIIVIINILSPAAPHSTATTTRS